MGYNPLTGISGNSRTGLSSYSLSADSQKISEMPFGRSGTVDLVQDKEVSLGQRLANWAPGALISFLGVYYIHKKLHPYSEPNTKFFAYQPSPTLSGNCLHEYWALHKTMLILLITPVSNLVLQILTHFKPCGGVLVCIVAVCESVLAIISLGISMYGFITVVFRYKLTDISLCEDLHNFAWWVYCGGLIILAIMMCCICGCMVAGIVAGKKDTSDEESDGSYLNE